MLGNQQIAAGYIVIAIRSLLLLVRSELIRVESFVMARQFETIAQDSCRMSRCRVFGISPWFLNKIQTFTQTQTVSNLYIYCIADKDYMLPGYNVSPVLHDSGSDEFGHGTDSLVKWRLYSEHQCSCYDKDSHLASCRLMLTSSITPIFSFSLKQMNLIFLSIIVLMKIGFTLLCLIAPTLNPPRCPRSTIPATN